VTSSWGLQGCVGRIHISSIRRHVHAMVW